MTPNEISKIRLHNQQIDRSGFNNVQNLVSWMGAIQAQDYNMSKWAVGIRVSGSTEQSIEKAFRKGEIIRTHLMRPTWHLVSSADIYWLLELTAPHIKPLLQSRHKHLELTETIINKSKSVIEKILVGGKHRTREELMLQLQNAKISTDGQRAAHLMLLCELDGIVCSGEPIEKKQTYALLEERVPKPQAICRDEALAELAKRYFTSHGPATIQDFIWWSGLRVKDAKNALELVKAHFTSVNSDRQTYWFTANSSFVETSNKSAHLLPAYDEFIISYRDRSASILAENHKKAISENGLFRPIVVVNGHVAGTWKRIQKKDKAQIETEYFQSNEQPAKNLIENAAARYGQFINREIEIVNFDS